MVFHSNLTNFRYPLVTRTLLGIQADPNNSVVWTVSILPLMSNSPSLFSLTLKIVPSAPTTIGITVTFMFPGFFNSLARSRYLFIFALLFSLYDLLERQNPRDDKFLIFFLIATKTDVQKSIETGLIIFLLWLI